MVLEIKNVRKFYGDKEALKPLYVTFTPGVYGLLGPNGAGKSTFMKLIAMLLEPSAGEIVFNGKEIRKQKKDFLKALGICRSKHACIRNLTCWNTYIISGR